MKADYKNWVPKGMIYGLGAATAGLVGAAAGVGLCGRGKVSSVSSAILGAGALGCGAFTAWCVYANKQFSYDGERKLSKQIIEGTAEYVTLPEGGIGLDVGCGSGAVVIANALHIMPQPDKAMTEICRVMKPDGYLFAPTFVHGEGSAFRLRMKLIEAFGFKAYMKPTAEAFAQYVGSFGFEILERAVIGGSISPLCCLIARKR